MEGMQGEGVDPVKFWIRQSELELQKHKETSIQVSFSAGFGKDVRTQSFIHHQNNRIRTRGQRDQVSLCLHCGDAQRRICDLRGQTTE